MGHANPQSEPQVLRLMQEHTSLHLDQHLTNRLRSSSTLPYIVNTVRVFTRKEPQPVAPGTCAAGTPGCVAEGGVPGCASEEGWIYAGNDVQMFSNIETAS